MKVCVVGAGSAGTEAAREAARCGAQVTLIDSLEEPLQEWRDWPHLIRPGLGVGTEAFSPPSGVDYMQDSVLSIRRGSVLSRRGELAADSIVAASGSAFEQPSFEARNKKGVFILDRPEAYSALGRGLDTAGSVVVSGEGARGMEVAERAAAEGRRVTLLASFWRHEPPGVLASGVLSDSAAEKGVSVKAGRVSRALGSKELEAVLADGEVIQADVLAIAPRRFPRPIPAPVAPGTQGGLRVGLDMKTTTPEILCAGGCAELAGGSLPPSTLEDEQAHSGRIAGANAAGGQFEVSPRRRFSITAFGLTWTRLGGGPRAASFRGMDVRTVSGRRGRRSACAILYDRVTGRIVGLETVAETSREPLTCFVPIPATLRSLAYEGSTGSSDISLISETARLGLEAWSKC